MKKRITIYLTEQVHEDLKKQAKEAGLSVSAYVVYLLWLEKQFIRKF